MARALAILAVIAGLGLSQPGHAQDSAGIAGGIVADAPSGQGWDDGAPGADDAGDGGDAAGIGLIEAPEGEAGIDADLLPGIGTGVFSDAPGISSFAERRDAAMPPAVPMIGPVDHPPVVVELFTSQGCSSCPPADEMLNDLAERDDILALSWHVDYWDYLGWADGFARPEFTERQQAYARSWGERAIYTPQMVVGGSDTLIAVRPADLMALIEAQMVRPAPVIVTAEPQENGFRISLTPRAPLGTEVAILLVRYLPQRDVQIRTGENRGMQMTYRNIVLSAERIGEWDGRAPLRMTVTAKAASAEYPDDTRHALLAQQIGHERRASGPILAGIRLD